MNGNLFLYIDPGTGSMLFSILMGLFAAAYFLLRAVWLKVKFFFTGRLQGDAAKGRKNGIVVYSEGDHYWNVFLPVLDELERRETPVLYYTSSKTDPVFEKGYKFITSEYIGEGNRAYARLNFLEADVCLMTTPGLDVYQLKKSRAVSHYSHVLHSIDDATSYRLFGIDYYDSVLLSGEYQKKAIRELEAKRGIGAKELIVAGCPYLDVLESKIAGLPSRPAQQFTVLVSPSWGPSAILSRYGEQLLDPLVRTGFHVIVRPHPQSRNSEGAMLDRLKARYNENGNLEWDFSRENIGSLARSDVMISDFSSIVFDYAFLFDRPFFYVNADFDDQIYDSSDSEETPWKFRVLEEIGIELKDSMFADIGKHLEGAASVTELREGRLRARDTAWQCHGESGARIADYLIQKQREISC